MYRKLSQHVVLQYVGLDTKKSESVRSAFKATFSRSSESNPPSVHRMRVWMILWCSEVHQLGQGFLDVGGLTKPRNQLEALARATGDFRGTGEFLIPNRNLCKNGVVDFRRTGHPEVEKATGIECPSDNIRNDECWRLQVAGIFEKKRRACRAKKKRAC